MPEGIARAFGISDEANEPIRIEHYDEGISPNEIPFWSALWGIKAKEQKRK